MEPQIRYAKTSDGVNIAYCVMGEGQPLVYTSNVWGDIHWYLHNEPTRREVDRLIASGWRVVRYDSRGFGSSDRDVGDLSLAARVKDLEAVVDHAEIDRFALCGYGQGGPVAITYAVHCPERVSHLVLVNSFALGSAYYQGPPVMRALVAMRAMAEEQWEFVTLTIATASLGFADTALARKTAELFRSSTSAKTFLSFVDAAEKVDVRDLLGELRVPTLVVLAQSGYVTEDPSRVLASSIPNARFVRTNDYPQELHSFVRGETLASSAPEPSAFRTVLFTDLVGHTEMMSRLGDEKGREVLREHERITRECLAAHGGAEVKTMGDGFLASFGSVTKAVECAVALQKALSALTPDPSPAAAGEGQSVFPLQVRCGLNAGEPIEEDGDLFGTTVILASRIAARAEGGEIMVANTVRELCAGKSFSFADRGEFAAKGFEEPVHVYEVRWRDA
jgi:class 3 adenylate cyclase/pimeloyl-ACP methyl ester carboxylesterase